MVDRVNLTHNVRPDRIRIIRWELNGGLGGH